MVAIADVLILTGVFVDSVSSQFGVVLGGNITGVLVLTGFFVDSISSQFGVVLCGKIFVVKSVFRLDLVVKPVFSVVLYVVILWVEEAKFLGVVFFCVVRIVKTGIGVVDLGVVIFVVSNFFVVF